MFQNRNKVMTLYCLDLNKKFYLREISRLTNIPLKTCFGVLNQLEKENILISEKHGKHKYYELNYANIKTKFYLLEAEIYKLILFLDKHKIFKSFLNELEPSDSIIIVHGSFAKYRENKDSDLDLLVIGKSKIPFYIIPYKLHKIELTRNEFIKALKNKEPLIKELLENHIILQGHSQLIDLVYKYGKN